MATPRHVARRRPFALLDAALLVALIGLVGLAVAIVLTVGAGEALIMGRLALGV